MKFIGLTILSAVVWIDVSAQSFSKIEAQFINGQVVITYDLDGDNYDKGYNVEVRSSFDNFIKPLSNLTGAFGDGVKPGVGLSITWDAAKELPEGFNNQIQFKLLGSTDEQGEVITAEIELSSGSKVKKGTSTDITWNNLRRGKYRLQLFRDNVKLEELGVVNSTDSRYNWQVSKDLQAGAGYELKLLNTANQDEVKSQSFSVASKVPLFLKVAPILVVGGAAGVLVGGGSDSDPGGGGGSILPAPPDPD